MSSLGNMTCREMLKFYPKVCWREFWGFRGQHFMTSPLEIVTSYGIHGQKSTLLPPGKKKFADFFTFSVDIFRTD